MIHRSLLQLSAGGANALAAVATSFYGIQIPDDFSVAHTLGTAQFQMTKRSQDCTVVVQCDVPNTPLKSLLGGRRAHPLRRKPQKVRRPSASTSTPVTMACGVSFSPHICPFHVEVTCHALLGQLLIDGVCFHDAPVSLAPGPERGPSELVYRGPNMSQAYLAEALANQGGDSSPMWSSPHAQSRPFDSRLNYLASPPQFFGHMPVHTVNPTLGENVTQLLACCGINDDLAQFVQMSAEAVQREERKAWLAVTRKEFVI